MKNKVATKIDRLDREIHDKHQQHTQKNTPLDTSLKWAPFAFLLACDAAGLKTRNTYKEHIAMVVAGNIMLNIAVQPVKKAMDRIRPNGEHKSFPSAHAATGFLTSEILYKELKENGPALKHSGYVISAVTCWLRLYHNKHWFSDVVGGALIGALMGSLSGKVFDNAKRSTKDRDYGTSQSNSH